MRAYLFALLTIFFWGVSPALEKVGVAKISPLAAVSLRSFFVAFALAGFFFASGGHTEVANNPKSIPFILLGALFAGLLGQLTYFAALKSGDVSRVVPIVASYPILAVIIGSAFLGEPLTFPRIAGTLLVVTGIFLLR